MIRHLIHGAAFVVFGMVLCHAQASLIGEGGRQPRVVVTSRGVACVVYAIGDVVHCSTSTDGGKKFSAPVKVASVEGLMCGMRRGPQIAATRGHLVITTIGKSGNIECMRSADDGRTWSARKVVSDVSGSAREGLHAMVGGGADEVLVVWLDLRNGKTELYGSHSTNGGADWSPNFLIYRSPSGAICQCCQPSVSSDREGGYHVMWRNSIGASRDAWMATSRDGKSFAHPQKLGSGIWNLPACPMDGGAIGVDRSGNVMSVWRRDRRVFSCRPNGVERELGVGSQPQVVTAGQGFVFVWERDGAIVCQSGDGVPPVVLGAGKFPSAAARPDLVGPVIVVGETPQGVSAYPLGAQ